MDDSIGHPEKPFDEYLAVYRGRCTTLNTRAFLLFIGMFLAYYGIIQVSGDLYDYDAAHSESIEANSARQAIVSSIAERQNRGQAKNSTISINATNVFDFATESEQHLLEDIDQTIDEEKKRRTEIKDSIVSFQILGSSVPFPTAFAPELWWLLLLLVLVYLRYMKNSALVALAKAIYVYKSRRSAPGSKEVNDNLRSRHLFDIAGAASPWLAPIRQRDIALGVRAEDVRQALGWTRESEGWARMLCVLLTSLFIAFGVHIVWLGFELSDTARPAVVVALQVPEVLSVILRGLLAIAVGATLYQAWSMLRVTRIDADPQAKNLTRREIVETLTVGAVALGIFGLYTWRWKDAGTLSDTARPKSQLRLKRLASNPRFEKRERIRLTAVPELEPGFYKNSETGIVHYVTPERIVRQVSQVDWQNLQRIEFTPDVVSLLHPLTASHVAERGALKLLKDQRIDQACEVLARAIEQEQKEPWRSNRSGRPSFRLYDLLSGLSVRFDRVDHREKSLKLLEAALDASSDSATVQLLSQRRAKWSDDSSAWHQKWADPRQQVTWSLPTGKSQFEAVSFVDGEVRSLY
jgi:hypothetical protein